MALDLYLTGDEGLEGVANPGQDPGIGAGDGFEVGMEGKGQGDGIVQATGSLHDGPATGATAENKYLIRATGIDIHLADDGLAIADNDPVGGAFPEPEQGIALAGTDGVECGLVPGETGLGCGPGWQIEGAHGERMQREVGWGEGRMGLGGGKRFERGRKADFTLATECGWLGTHERVGPHRTVAGGGADIAWQRAPETGPGGCADGGWSV